jgi:lysophospholipase L1-like esterase
MDSTQWENDILAFEAADRLNQPPLNEIVFMGASGFRMWEDLATDFPNHTIINRAFGGSQIADSTYYADRIIIPYKPRLIVASGGNNDLACGLTPEQVAANYRLFVEKIWSALPNIPIAFFSIQPTPARWTQFGEAMRANQLIKQYIDSHKKLDYINAVDDFLTNGQPRPELFVEDMLHHNREGYKLRAKVVGDYLKGK